MNIEKTISEHAVSDILTPMLESQDRIVTEDVAPLFNKATGLDTPPASGTVTTTIEESRSVITAIIRKAWTAPLTMLGGASVLSSIAAAYTYLRNRLQGNETYGIPDRRSEISASSPLAANLALLNDRKMYDGLYDANGDPMLQDGESLIALLTNSARAARVVEIRDTNIGWVANKSQILRDVARIFTNLQKITLNCESITTVLCGGFNYIEMNNRDMIFVFTNVKSIPNGQVIGDEYTTSNFRYTEAHIHWLETTNQTNNTFGAFRCNKLFFYDYKVGAYRVGGSASYHNPITQYIYIACLGNKTDLIRFWCDGQAVNSSVKDIEIRDGMCQSLTIQNLNGLTAENMYNHILLRLKQDEPNCGSGVTITLGTTNIEKLEAVEEYNTKLTELEDTYGYTFA